MAQDELILLERVQLRIGSATTDEELQNNVCKFLPPVLLKLSSQQEGVRKKVMELLVHINKRIKSRPSVQLPVEALLLQYQDPSATSFIINFTIIYIKLGFPRMEISKQAELVPSMLNCLDGKPQCHQDSLMLLIVKVLNHIEYPKVAEKSKALFNLTEKPHIAKLILSFMLDVLLLPYGVNPPAKSSPSNSGSSSNVSVPPGLSEQAFRRVTGDTPMKPEELENVKIGILKLLGSGVFNDEDIICHLIVSSADTRFIVVNEADLLLKRIPGDFNWNQPIIISKLYQIFLGSTLIKDKQSINPNQRRVPASTRIKLKLMPYFFKSKEAASQIPSCIQVVFDCWYGANSNGKLKVMALNFVQYIILVLSEAKLATVSSILLSGLVKLIADHKEDLMIRSLAYISVGRLGQKIPSAVTKELSLLQTFFDALPQEEKDVQSSLQEALFAMSTAFRSVNSERKPILQSLLANFIDRPHPTVRLLGVQYCLSVFLPSDVMTRYLLLLASGDREPTVATEAVNGLLQFPVSYMRKCEANELDSFYVKGEAYPKFADIVIYIFDNANQRINKNKTFSYGSKRLAFNVAMYTHICEYLHHCLAYSINLPPDDSYSFEGKGAVLKDFMLSYCNNEPNPILCYVDILENFLSISPAVQPLKCLHELVSIIPDKLTPRYKEKLQWIENMIYSSKEEIRDIAAQLYSCVVISSIPVDEFDDCIKKLINNVNSKKFETAHGSILALGYSVGGKCASEKDLCKHDAFIRAIDILVDMLSYDNVNLVSAACTALGYISKYSSLPYEEGSLEIENQEVPKTKFLVLKKLIDLFKSKSLIKIREKALLNMSFIGIGDANLTHRKYAMGEIMATASDLKDIELQFATGEALVNLSLGPFSPGGRNTLMISEADFTVPKVAFSLDSLDWLLEELIKNYATKSHPLIKQASCIWLLSILKVGVKYEPIKKRILEFQQAFLNMLNDPNELILDGASKGIALIYESCNEEEKEKLVQTLTSTLNSGQRPVQKVDGNSQLFEEGTLGKDPSGGKLSTYKELCSLASDLNKPDLIYKFLHIANHNALWNSKKGAAFGFSRIAQLTGVQMEPHLAQIVPRLYRYKFDPHFETQKAMKNIWDSLVTDSSKTVSKYYVEILSECASHLEDNQWRVREACCTALNELFSVANMEQTLSLLPEIWISLFRVQDDIKESVRKSAEKTLHCLSNCCIQVCNDGSVVGSKVLEITVPILVKTGISSNVPEVRNISIQTILKVSQKAKALLKPHVGVLIPGLLENLTITEPVELNYLSTRLGTETDAQEKLDGARISAMKSSPLIKAVNLCLQFIDDESMKELIPKLLEQLKGHVGITTRAGAAHVVKEMVRDNKEALRPYAGKVVGVLVNGLTNRSVALRKVFAATIGEVAKLLKDSSFVKLGDKLTGWFLEKNDDDSMLITALIIKSIFTYSFDTLSIHACWSLPMAYLGMQIPKPKNTDIKAVSEVWEEIWNEGVSGTEYGIKLYLTDIIALCERIMDTSFWNKKVMAASALGGIAKALGPKFMNKELLSSIKLLVKASEGRTWEGKEAVIASVCEICVQCSENIKSFPLEENLCEEIKICFIREFKKENNISYRTGVLDAIGPAIHALQLDCFEELYCILMPILNKEIFSQDESEEDDDNSNYKTLLIPALKCLGNTWPQDQSRQEKYYLDYLKFLHGALNKVTRKMQLSIIEAFYSYVDRLWLFRSESANHSQLSLVFELTWKLLRDAISVPKYPSLRKETINLLLHLKDAVAMHKDLAIVNADELISKLKEVESECPAQIKQDVTTAIEMFTCNHL